jgi:hypothetical protein
MRGILNLLLLFAVLIPALLRAAPPVSFADLSTGREAIVDDPAYFDHLQPMEMAAKTGGEPLTGTVAKQRAECRRRYQAAVREFTQEEQTAIRNVVALIDPAVRKGYPQFADTPWNFLKVSGNLEAGFPHTRGKYIIFSENICRMLSRPRSNRQQVPLDKMELLLHEQMHVFQRAHADLFDSLYTGQWGFIRAKSITTCPWIVEHQLLNPDAVDCPWVFPIKQSDGTRLAQADGKETTREPRYIWPLVSLSDGPGPKVMKSDSSMLAFYVTRDGESFRVEQAPDHRPKYSELMSVRAYRGVFPKSTNIYHPHEASADLFAKLVLFDSYQSARMGEGERAEAEKSFGPLRAWFGKNFGEASH